jgi:hypothetical protein
MICLQGRVRFPTGGIVRERSCAGFGTGPNQDLVKFQNRQYSLDGRRCVEIIIETSGCFAIVISIYCQSFSDKLAGLIENIFTNKVFNTRKTYLFFQMLLFFGGGYSK